MEPFKPTHVSHKQVEAHPIAAAEFRSDGSGRIALKSGALIDVPAGFASRGAPAEGDMLVRYEPIPGQTDGYLSHSPRMVFEAGYAPLSQEADARGEPALTLGETQAIVETKTAPRVTEASIKAKIADVEYFRVRHLTICIITLRNGFFVEGHSAPAAPENYDQQVGERYAYENAFRQLWPLEGYLLREQLAASEADPVRAA
ncbi:Gp49 family protein [Methylobacterium sp. C1]|uniref:Gp49 family protein n=1 Tax=Methylobacterium sp. C1 TaxID=1479019 RepID=UPI000B011A02|nr:Gp49 family protein [Methylobacterium sp. C1]